MSIDIDKVFSDLEGFDIEIFDRDKLKKELDNDPDYPIDLTDFGYENDEELAILTSVEKIDDSEIKKLLKK